MAQRPPNFRTALIALFRSTPINPSQEGAREWSSSFREFLFYYGMEITQVQTSYDRVYAETLKLQYLVLYVEAIEVLLDFDFGDVEARRNRILSDAQEQLFNVCKTQDDALIVLRIIKHIVTVNPNINPDFISQETQRCLDIITRDHGRETVKDFSACSVLRLFAEQCSKYVASLSMINIGFVEDVLQIVMNEERTCVVARDLLRALLKHQIVMPEQTSGTLRMDTVAAVARLVRLYTPVHTPKRSDSVASSEMLLRNASLDADPRRNPSLASDDVSDCVPPTNDPLSVAEIAVASEIIAAGYETHATAKQLGAVVQTITESKFAMASASGAFVLLSKHEGVISEAVALLTSHFEQYPKFLQDHEIISNFITVVKLAPMPTAADNLLKALNFVVGFVVGDPAVDGIATEELACLLPAIADRLPSADVCLALQKTLVMDKRPADRLEAAIKLIAAHTEFQKLEVLQAKLLDWIKSVLSPAPPAGSTRAPPVNVAKGIRAWQLLTGLSTPQNTAVLAMALAVLPESLENTAASLRECCASSCLSICACHVGEGVSLKTKLNNTVVQVLGKLLDSAVSDPAEEVRLTTLQNLCSLELDSHLVLSDCLEALFMCVHDRHSETGQCALRLVCRLATLNPALVVPGLQNIHQQMLKNLQGAFHTEWCDAAKKLTILVTAGRVDCPPAVIESTLLEKLAGRVSHTMQTKALYLLAAVLQHAPTGARHIEFEPLVDRCMQALRQGTSVNTRAAAAAAMVSIMRNVAMPQDKHLNAELIRLIFSVHSGSALEHYQLQDELMRLIGVIGAVHPERYRQLGIHAPKADSANPQSVQLTEMSQLRPPARSHPRLADQNASVALYILVKCMRTSTPMQQRNLLQCMHRLTDTIGVQQRGQIVPHLVPCLLQWLEDPKRQHLQLGILQLLVFLWQEQRDAFSNSVTAKILSTLEVFIGKSEVSPKLATQTVLLLEHIARGAPEQIQNSSWVISFILQRLIDDRGETSDLMFRCVEALEALVFCIEKELVHVVPQVLSCFSSGPQANVQLKCLTFLNAVAHYNTVKERAASIIHAVLHLIDGKPNEEVIEASIGLLCNLLSSVGKPARRFLGLITKELSSKNIEHAGFQALVEQYEATGGFPQLRTRRPGDIPASLNDRQDHHLVFTVTSQRELTARMFEAAVAEAVRIPENHVLVKNLDTTGGKTTIEFSFDASQAEVLHAFVNKLNEDSALRRKLDIVDVAMQRNESRGRLKTTSGVFTKLRWWRRLSRSSTPQEWMAWLGAVAVELVHCSAEPAVRVLRDVVQRNEMVAKEIFPFAFVSTLEVGKRAEAMEELSSVIRICAPEVRHLLFALSEFMESERVEKVEVVTIVKPITCKVVRPNSEAKFGIHYEREGSNIVVMRVAPGLPGEHAGVPVGYTLKKIDGHDIQEVNEIVRLINNKTTTVLQLVKETEERRIRVPQKDFFDWKSLGEVAQAGHLYAKAVHNYELWYEELLLQYQELAATERELGQGVAAAQAAGSPQPTGTPSTSLVALLEKIKNAVDALTNLFNIVDLAHENLGILRFTREALGDEQFNLDDRASAFDSFGRQDTGSHGAVRYSQLRYLEVRGESEVIVAGATRLLNKAQSLMTELVVDAEIARSCANAAVALTDWGFLAEVTKWVPESPERTLYELIGAISGGNKEKAARLFKQGRQQLSTQFATEIAESYSTSYDTTVMLQHFNHLEEVLCHKYSTQNETKALLQGLWSKRLFQMARSVQHWSTSLAINALVIPPDEDIEPRLAFASLCREAGWRSTSVRTLKELLKMQDLTYDVPLPETVKPQVAIAFYKHLWQNSKRKGQREKISASFEAYMNGNARALHTGSDVWCRCHLLLGEWSMSNNPEAGYEAVRKATQVDAQNIAAWHAWGMLNFRRAHELRETSPATSVSHFFVNCIEGLCRAVEVGEDRLGTQDTLRIMSVWLRFGHDPIVQGAMNSAVEHLPVSAWLRVVPQLIARLGVTQTQVRELLIRLIQNVAHHYPHALIYSLTVCEKTAEDALRRQAAHQILVDIREAHPQLVDQVSLISDELKRIAILWPEKWSDGLARASKVHGDVPAVQAILKPLYIELENPVTANEKNFESLYGQTLKRARHALEANNVLQAWQFFQQVFGQISRQIPRNVLQLPQISPRLSELRNTCVPVPGVVDHKTGSQDAINVVAFQSECSVIVSKHRPRKFSVIGSDDRRYTFLLKGHEDLRQDERVMQLFELVNTLFATDPTSVGMNLFVTRYSALPLSDNVGILGWIEESDTMFRLLEARRQAHNVSMYEECNLISRVGRLSHIDEYQKQPKPVRKELLSLVLRATPSDELRMVMWDRNDSSEAWLQYRTRYGRSLALMSMVGYILGLGDRHLNNLILQKHGNVVHIDYGDCFEVAMRRQHCPEAVPFRLTRLLVKALGVMGVEGTFRCTSENVMRLLRKYKESLMSVLETFVEDPLMNWRLPSGDGPTQEDTHKASWDKFFQYIEQAGGVRQLVMNCHVDPVPPTTSPYLGPKKAPHSKHHHTRSSSLPHDMEISLPKNFSMDEVMDRIKASVEKQDFDCALRLFKRLAPILQHDIRYFAEGQVRPDFKKIFLSQTANNRKNRMAQSVMQRVDEKLAGRDFRTVCNSPDTSSSPFTTPTNFKTAMVSIDSVSANATSSMQLETSLVLSKSVEGQVFELSYETGDDIIFQRNSVGNSFRGPQYVRALGTDPTESHEGQLLQNGGMKDEQFDVVDQVNRLIQEATSLDNLADAFLTGWAPFL